MQPTTKYLQHQSRTPVPPVSMRSTSSSCSSVIPSTVCSTNSTINACHGRSTPPPSAARCGGVSPGLKELMQWMNDGGDRRHHSSSTANAREQQHSVGWVAGMAGKPGAGATVGPNKGRTTPVPAAMISSGSSTNLPAPDALIIATAIKNAVRLQHSGYRPGVMGGRVGLLEGLRTRDMDKYDETIKPKKRRAPPTNLSGLTAEEIVARRNRLAREYSHVAQERRIAAEAMLEGDAAALRFMRLVMEGAPGIVYLTLSADMHSLVLYANQGGAQEVLGLSPTTLFGRPFVEFVHPDDRPALYKHLAVLILSKNPDYRSSLRLRVCSAAAGSFQLVDARFRFGALGVACSLWMRSR